MKKLIIMPIVVGVLLCTGCNSSENRNEDSNKSTEETITEEITTEETTTGETTTEEKTSEETTTEETTPEETTPEETTPEETTPEETTPEETTPEETTPEETTTKNATQKATEADKKIKFRKVDEIVYAKEYTKVYSKYNTESATIGELGMGNTLKRVGICNGWSQVEFEGKTGYVLTAALTTDKAAVEKNMEYYDKQFEGDCFIGDSRTQGLFNTSQIITADFLCSVGQNISDVRTDEKTLNHLKTKKYRNIYIEFGINEMGWSDLDKFERCYEEFVNIVKQYQPKAHIYIQGVIPVTKTKSDKNQTYAPHRVQAFDERIKSVAKKTNVTFLDVAIGICGDSRILPENVAPDGVHMGKYHNDKWLDYIIENREK